MEVVDQAKVPFQGATQPSQPATPAPIQSQRHATPGYGPLPQEPGALTAEPSTLDQ